MERKEGPKLSALLVERLPTLLGLATLGFVVGRLHRKHTQDRVVSKSSPARRGSEHSREEHEEEVLRPIVKNGDGGPQTNSKVRQTDRLICRRCERIMDWEEANRPMKPRPHADPADDEKLPAPGNMHYTSGLLQGAKNALGLSKSSESSTSLGQANSESSSSSKLKTKGKKRSRVSWAPIKTQRTVCCFGDSNTWGHDPVTQDRLEERWPRVMAEVLGKRYHVVEAGLNGRTIDKVDKVRAKRLGYSSSGSEHLEPILNMHKPLDLVIIFLGVNDLKDHLTPTAGGITTAMRSLIRKLKSMPVFRTGLNEQTAFRHEKKILLLAPSRVKAENEIGFSKRSVKVSSELSNVWKSLAEELDVFFLDTAAIVEYSELDAVHLGADAHRTLGKRVAQTVEKIFSRDEVF